MSLFYSSCRYKAPCCLSILRNCHDVAVSILKPIFDRNPNPFMLGRRMRFRPPTRTFHLVFTNKLVSQNPRRPNMNPDRPNARANASGGMWLHWVPLALGFASGMSISRCLFIFCLRCYPRGMWNLVEYGLKDK